MTAVTADDVKKIVDTALASLGDIATLPQVTIKIIEIVENPKSTARDLHDVIKMDPALSAKVLKVVNSAFYGLPGQIASVDRAIVLLGLAAVKNISIAASIARMFKGSQISEHFSAKDLWQHSVAVGVTARELMKLANSAVSADEVFVAGLIHDIGMLVERQAHPEKFAKVVDTCMNEGGNFMQREVEIIGATHQDFGAGLTTKWRFPRHLRAAVGFHHSPEHLSAELRHLGMTIQLADIICCQDRLGFYLTAWDGEISEELLQQVGVSLEDVAGIRHLLPEAVAEAESMLGG